MSNDDRIRHLEKCNVLFVPKRQLLMAAMVMQSFFNGLNYTIIFPSMWQYLKRFGSSRHFFGLTAAIYQVSALIALPIVGRIYDRTKRVKEITFVLNIFQLIGDIMYSLPFSIWLVFFGRLISGIGASYYPAINSEIAWITTSKDRLRAYGWIQIGFFMGIILGPALTFVFTKVNITLGSWHIDYTNAPGLSCAIAWLSMQIVIPFAVRNLAKDFVLQEDSEGGQDETVSLIESKESHNSITNNQDDEEKERDTESSKTIKPSNEDTQKLSLLNALKEIFAFDVCAIHFASFWLWAYFLAGETMAPLITQEDFHWSTFYTALMFVFGAALMLVLTSVISHFGKHISELLLIFVALACSLSGVIFLILYQWKRTDHTVRLVFYFACVIVTFASIPVEDLAATTLLSKLVPNQAQGLMQSTVECRRKLSNIIGPILGSIAYTHLIRMSLVGVSAFVISGFWIYFVSNRLRGRKAKYAEDAVEANTSK